MRGPGTPACSPFHRTHSGSSSYAADVAPPAADPPEMPVFALATVACTLAGFVLASAAGLSPA